MKCPYCEKEIPGITCPDCGAKHDRDINAAINLQRLDGSWPDAKRAQETCETDYLAMSLTARTGASIQHEYMHLERSVDAHHVMEMMTRNEQLLGRK